MNLVGSPFGNNLKARIYISHFAPYNKKGDWLNFDRFREEFVVFNKSLVRNFDTVSVLIKVKPINMG